MAIGAQGEGRLQTLFHLLESSFGLIEEAEDDAAGELAVFLVVVHFEDLLEGHGVDAVAKLGQLGPIFGLLHSGIVRDELHIRGCQEQPRRSLLGEPRGMEVLTRSSALAMLAA